MLKSELFVGLDMVDGCRPSPRQVDVAVLDRSLACTFDQWDFDPKGTGLHPGERWAPGFVLAIDGPQGLAGQLDASMRECERQGGIPGKSPYEFPPLRKPYAGFVVSSIKLFAALWKSGKFHLHGFPQEASHQATLIEVYPGRGWRKLAELSRMNPKSLKKKARREGREQRLSLLKENGVRPALERLPTHDQLDAALAALIAFRFAENKHTREGAEPSWDESEQVLREGFIIYP